jgi:chorismate synthase
MVDEIKEAAKDGDSLGGVVEAIAYGVPVGLGATSTGTASSTPRWPRPS